MADSPDNVSFFEHLEELRWRIIKSAIAIIVFAVPCGIYWEYIFEFVMIYPLRFADPKPRLIITSPIEGFMLSIKIAIVGGIIGAAPVIFYQLWRFIAPGLYKKEKVIILPTVFFSTLSFLGGISFCYFVLPYIVRFLAEFTGDKLDAMFKTNEYMAFLIKLMLAFGIVFELPIISFVLSKLGLITPQFLIKNSRYAIVIIFVLAAILTPPDILSQTLLAVPLMVLYLISIVVSYSVYRKQK